MTATPCVIYGAKSTEDRHESIPGQLEACREMSKRQGWTVLDEYKDEGFSAFSGNRGDDLVRARERAAQAAIEYGTVAMLVCRHSDRISRGAGDQPGASQALVEIWHESRRANVHLRSCSRSDDRDLETSAGAANIGERNRADSARKSEATRDGYDRARRRGTPLFGIVPDGYLLQRWYDSDNEAQRRMIQDPDRKALWELVWSLAADGWTDRAIVLELDRRDYQTAPRKKGQQPRPFDANRIRLALANAVYAGLQVGRVHEDDCDPSRKKCCEYRREVVGEGNWPAYVSVEDFERIAAERRVRSHVAQRKGGRPPIGYLLGNGLARCECGAVLDCVTSRHVNKKDGVRPRRYVCRAHRERPQDCAAKPIDAVEADRIVLAGIDSLIIDSDKLREQLGAGRRAEFEKLGQVAHAAREEAVAAERSAERADTRFADALDTDDEDAREVLLAAAARKRREARQATERANAALDAMSQAAEEPQDDGEHDLVMTRVWMALSGRVKDADGDIKTLNTTLANWFERFEIDRDTNGTLRVVPVLSVEALMQVVREPAKFPNYAIRPLDETGTAFEVTQPGTLTAAPGTHCSPW